MAKNEAKSIEKQPSQALARPDFIPSGDQRGTEHITKADLRLPRLALAQGLSTQLVPGDPTFIEGLKQGDMFNDLTGEIIGRGPITVAIIRGDKPRHVEFVPREQGGGVKDLNVPADDPRTQFKDGQKPLATKFYDFVALILPLRPEEPEASMIALSFKSSGLKTALKLNSLIALRSAPIYAGNYALTSLQQKNSKGTFAVIDVVNAGWAGSPEELKLRERLYERIADKNLVLVREPGSDDEDAPPFDVPSAKS